MTSTNISHRVSQLRPTAINSILAEVAEFQKKGGEPVSLMRGQPDFATPAHIVEAAVQSMSEGRTSYPNNQGELALRAAISQMIREQGGGSYSPNDEILVTDGATLGVYAALSTVLNPGNGIILPEPIYDAYHSVIALVGGIVQPVPAKLIDGRFELDPQQVAAACTTQTKALLLNTPWNPTGTVLTRDDLATLMSVASDHDLTVISDEIYKEIVYDGRSHVSPAAISDEARKRTIIVNSFSKTFSMTGWRLGYCAGPKELIRSMYLVIQQSSRGPATFVQDAGVAALEGTQDCISQMIEEYSSRRQSVCDALSEIPRIVTVPPEGGFFVMVDARGLEIDSNQIRRRLLQDFGVVVMHGGAYGPSAEGMLRVSFASGGQNLEAGLELLREGLTKLSTDV